MNMLHLSRSRLRLLFFVFALALSRTCEGASFETNAPFMGYAPATAHASLQYQVTLGRSALWSFPGEFQMTITSRLVLSSAAALSMRGDVTVSQSGFIRVKFPFGGKFRGHYDPDRNAIVGRLFGFYHQRELGIASRRFELEPFEPLPPG